MTRTEIAPLVLSKEQMNLLQGEAGLISDLCVSCADIAEQDWGRVREWVEKQQSKESPECLPNALGCPRSDFQPQSNADAAQNVL